MRILVKLFGWLVLLGVGVIVGFMISPAKQGFGNTVNYNYKDNLQPNPIKNENES